MAAPAAPALRWDLYRTLLAVLETGSLSGAARALDITQPTAGRHIAALESAFGQPLFTRAPAGLLPTATALALRSHAESLRHTAAALERTARRQSGTVRGTVRISASEVMGVEVLPGLLTRLRAEHPALTLELMPTNQVENLLHRAADIAVRMTAPQQDALIAQRVGTVWLGLYAHAEYLACHGMPTSTAELAGHTLIGFETDSPFLRMARQQAPFWQRDAFALRSDSDLAQLALVRAGAGIGVCQVALAQRTPPLVAVLPNAWQMPLDTWVTMHEDLRTDPACHTVFTALADGLRHYTTSAAPGTSHIAPGDIHIAPSQPPPGPVLA